MPPICMPYGYCISSNYKISFSPSSLLMMVGESQKERRGEGEMKNDKYMRRLQNYIGIFFYLTFFITLKYQESVFIKPQNQMDHPSHSNTHIHTHTPFKHKVQQQIRKMLIYYHHISEFMGFHSHGYYDGFRSSSSLTQTISSDSQMVFLPLEPLLF